MLGLSALSRKVFGSANDRRLKKYHHKVNLINSLEEQLVTLSDDDLRSKTEKFRTELQNGNTLDNILPQAFALVREAAKRTLGQRHFDVQLIGGMVLNEGKIAEMKTGEGKTLVATLPVYLNALAGKGVHIVTVNDYLAKRDAEWMGQIYQFLGLSVGVIAHGITEPERRQAYNCDVTYGTNNEYGFDYLRDNMVYDLADMTQRGHHYAIVDEVDSILVDEARTPLIISGAIDDQSKLYTTLDKLIPELSDDDYEIDEKLRTVILTEDGNETIENILLKNEMITVGRLYDVENVSLVHHINQALRAHKLFEHNRDYIVKNGQVVIIDEFTGRMMEGRRYSEGLHQAIEAKEGVAIQPENKTLASITFQNYFRLYDKLAGMTGTAVTEAAEFMDIYALDVIEIPTNLPVIRDDLDDEVYRSADEKYQAITDLITDCQKRDQPVLVGTTSIAKSEHLALLLKKCKVKHQVLNARYHEQEAFIIAEAGNPGMITIATNMAGRGTDIQLGGNLEMRLKQELGEYYHQEGENQQKALEIRADIEQKRRKVLAAGGLYVIGSERHESRRIDNQLRGRTGRQGDPGRSKFFLSLDDDLMRIFGSERMNSTLQTLGLKEGEAIAHSWINRALEKAQQKVEARNFDIRKNLLKFDDVVNDQRKVIFDQRVEIIMQEDISDVVSDMRQSVIDAMVEHHIPKKAYPEQWKVDELGDQLREVLNLNLPIKQWSLQEEVAESEIRQKIYHASDEYFANKEIMIGAELTRKIEKALLLQTLDFLWREHLAMLDHLRQVIGLRGYAQRDPLNEYKSEAFHLFDGLLNNLRLEVTKNLVRLEPAQFAQQPKLEPIPIEDIQMKGGDLDAPKFLTPSKRGSQYNGAHQNVPPDATPQRIWGKIPRNAPCPCGSGKKYKHCHGRLH